MSELRFTTVPALRPAAETRSDGCRTLSGYAAVFYLPSDSGSEYRMGETLVERIKPGAFSAALASGADVIAVYNHDVNMLLGRRSAGTLRLSEDQRGLRYEIDLPETSYAGDLVASVKRGDISGSSFRFTVSPDGERMAREGNLNVRYLQRLSLIDVGPVTMPAYEGTSVSLRSDSSVAVRARRIYVQTTCGGHR